MIELRRFSFILVSALMGCQSDTLPVKPLVEKYAKDLGEKTTVYSCNRGTVRGPMWASTSHCTVMVRDKPVHIRCSVSRGCEATPGWKG